MESKELKEKWEKKPEEKLLKNFGNQSSCCLYRKWYESNASGGQCGDVFRRRQI